MSPADSLPNFVITGLPRSGTAFLASSLNLSPDIHAYHERRSEGILERPAGFEGFLGDSCASYLVSSVNWELTKVVYIKRRSSDAFNSLDKVGVPLDPNQRVQLLKWRDGFEQQALANPDRVLEVSFEDLFQPSTVATIMKWITDKEYTPWPKIVQACKMNIQRASLEYNL